MREWAGARGRRRTETGESTCDVADEDLVAYLEEDLRGARREWVEAHLAACPHCGERLVRFAAVDALLRAPSPFTDEAHAEAALRARWEAMAPHLTAPPRPRWRGWPRRWQPRWPRALVVALGLKVVVLALLLWPGLELNTKVMRVSLVAVTLLVIATLTPLRHRRSE